MSALNQLDEETRGVIREVLARRAPQLLEALDSTAEPDTGHREQVTDVLASEFEDHVSAPDWEPTEWGKKVDSALGWFLKRFPIEDSS